MQSLAEWKFGSADRHDEKKQQQQQRVEHEPRSAHGRAVNNREVVIAVCMDEWPPRLSFDQDVQA